MDNFLVQITGRKRVVLFSPRDALNMYLHGDKSAVIDIDHPDTTKYPLFQNAMRYECTMSPGDVLYIPAAVVSQMCAHWTLALLSTCFGDIWMPVTMIPRMYMVTRTHHKHRELSR